MPDEPVSPLSPGEIASYRAQAATGNPPSLDIIRRFIFTVRKTFTASPVKMEKSKVSRNTKPKKDESQIDFF